MVERFLLAFLSNCSYEKVIKAVLKVLLEEGGISSLDIKIPDELIESFGDECKSYELLNEQGNFDNPERLVDLFCGKLTKTKK